MAQAKNMKQPTEILSSMRGMPYVKNHADIFRRLTTSSFGTDLLSIDLRLQGFYDHSNIHERSNSVMLIIKCSILVQGYACII